MVSRAPDGFEISPYHEAAFKMTVDELNEEKAAAETFLSEQKTGTA